MSKEAVVFVLDAHPSMGAPYPSNTNDNNSESHGPSHATETDNSTRLSCAKEALEGMISQLIIQSVQNEVGVIVLNSEAAVAVKTEDGYMDDDGNGGVIFHDETNPNIMELSMPCITRPTVQLLQAIRRVECSMRNYPGADVCQGLVVAEKALRHRTFKKKFARRLVVFTDAAHRVDSSNDVILRVIDRLRELECTLTVIGVDFEHSAKFEEPLAEDKAAVKKEDTEDGVEGDPGQENNAASDSDETEVSGNDGEAEESDSDDDDDDVDPLIVKRQNEQLLISVARLTGGSIMAATTMKEVVESALGKRIPKSTKKKIKFHIAPGLTLDARCSLLLSKASFPTLKKLAVQLDDSGNKLVDPNGDLVANPIKMFTDHFNPDDMDQEVPESSRTNGYRYGADYIPMSSVDKEGLRLLRSEPAIRILGYTNRSVISRSLLIGPPYAISGHDSHRTCCAIAALAQGLQRLGMVAICINFKTKSADPILGALFPLEEDGGKSEPTRLFFIQLPFADDVRTIRKDPLVPVMADSAESRACDSLIDAMMLPPDALRSEQIPNPSIRSFRKTVKNIAVDPSSTGIVTVRDNPSVDPMSTPVEVLRGASSVLDTFRTTFPREKIVEQEGNAKKKKKYWGDV